MLRSTHLSGFDAGSRPTFLSGAIFLILFAPYFLPVMLRPEMVPTDDAYFYFQIALNIANGVGVTFNSVTPTNGFHPLWMAVCVIVFLLIGTQKLAAMRVISLIQQGMFLYMLHLLRRLSREVGIRYWYAGIPFLAFGFLATAMYGVEAFLNALTVVAALVLFVRARGSNELHDYAVLGLMLGLCFLARLDNVFFIGSLGLLGIIRVGRLL
ncbi:MAG TPA: hypothetical protein VMO47_06115 [Rhodothermales bacterium]|nr:hypothetical protein [Rhodothermales bacterium]